MKGGGRGARMFVGVVWVLMLGLALGFVLHYGGNVPYWDDWDMVPVVAGEQPITAAWLWAPHNEHRIPLPKLVYVALVRTTDDLRAGMVFNVVCAGLASLVLVVALARERGCSFADAFVPVALLPWGHYHNFLWCFQVAFALWVLLAACLLAVLLRCRGGLTFRGALIAAACLLCLPLCGANGVALVPALGVWLSYAGLRAWRTGNQAAAGLACLGTATAVGLAIGYFIGLPGSTTGTATLTEGIDAALQFLSMGLGVAGREHWFAAGLLIAAGTLLAAIYLAWTWFRSGSERVRAAGLLCFLGGMASLTAGIAWGRGGQPEAATAARYSLLSVPLLLALYGIGSIYARPLVRRVLSFTLLGVMAVALVPNTNHALARARERRERTEAIVQEIKAGATSGRLAAELVPYFWAESKRSVLAERLETLRKARRKPFEDTEVD